MNKLPLLQERSCHGCVKCCEGWLAANIKGHKMRPGKPCFYLSEGPLGCSEYPTRPKEPCIDYRCAWLDEPDMPYELRPSRSNLLVSRHHCRVLTDDGIERREFFEVVRAGDSYSSEDVEAIKAWAKRRKVQLCFSLTDESIGPELLSGA